MRDRAAGLLVACSLATACMTPPAHARDVDPATVTSLTVAEALELSQLNGELSFPRLATLAPDVADALVAQPIDRLDLPALTAIEPDVAEALVRRGRLYELRLDGVKSLGPEAARVLARHAYRLRLGGLEAIPPGVAAEFAAAGGHLTSLALPLPPGTPVESLRLLAGVGHNLEFVGPVTVTAGFADAFARFAKYVALSGSVAPLDPEVARTLTFPGTLHVPGAIELSDEVAGILATRAGDTWITGLTAITPGVARMLAARRESVSLLRLTEIDPASAAVLATHAGPALHFGALESLSPDVARALAGKRGPLVLCRLKRITPAALMALAEKDDVDIPPVDTLEIVPEFPGGPVEDVVLPETFLERQRRR